MRAWSDLTGRYSSALRPYAEVGDGVQVLAKVGDAVVAARQKNLLALAFHPELTDDSRVHQIFLKMLED